MPFISSFIDSISNPFVSPYLGSVDAVSPYLDGVIDSVCCDLDATIEASYTSGQTWANLISSPADGAGQTDYDFFLGKDGSASTDDPTHTGTVGDPAAYFALDGGDNFTAKVFSSIVPTIWDMHKTTSSGWWIAIAFQTPSGGKRGFFGGGGANGNSGLTIYQDEASGYITQWTNPNSNNTFPANSSYTGGADNIIVLSVDMSATSSNVKNWHSTKTGSVASKAFTAFTGDADGDWNIASTNNAGVINSAMLNNTRLYSFAIGNELLDDAKATAIIDHLNARHSRTYA